MLGWIPVIGPIFQGIVSIWKGYQNVDIKKYTVDGKVDIAAMQTYANIITATQDDIGVRLCRDLIMFPVGLWTALISWDNMVVDHWPNWTWTVEKYPPGMEYLPYAVIAFLFGAVGMSIWKR